MYEYISKAIRYYRIEVIVIVVCLLSFIITSVVYLVASSSNTNANDGEIVVAETAESEVLDNEAGSIDESRSGEDMSISHEKIDATSSGTFIVEISGAVNKPGVYEFHDVPRLEDAIQKADGLSINAAKEFFARNYNRARVLRDQEKIHVPSIYEIEEGVFIEERFLIKNNALSDVKSAAEAGDVDLAGEQGDLLPSGGSKININTASSDQLEELQGIGPVTAGKIIQGRPYMDVNDLIEKSVLGEKTFENIQEYITL